MEFKGATPYVLVVVTPNSSVAIDLDEPGWTKTHATLMRTPGRWILARKIDSEPILVMQVLDGEQPYYTARVVGSASLPPPDAVGISQDEMFELKDRAEVRAYGIGKKRLDGHVDRMWILPTGSICAGDDVDSLSYEMARARLFALLRSKQDGSHDRGQRAGGQGPREEEGDQRQEDRSGDQGRAGKPRSRKAGRRIHQRASGRNGHGSDQ